MKKTILMILFAIMISACSTNSGFVLRSAYNNLDFILKTKINSYADFNQSQEEWIDLSVQDFHLWHRQNQLPQILEIVESSIILLNENQGYRTEIIEAYINKTRDLYQEMYLSSPLFDAPPLLKQLTEKQVNQIKEKMLENREKYLESLEENTEDQDKRVERIESFLDFFEIDLNKKQMRYVKSQLNNFKDTDEENHKIFKQWQDKFIALLSNREKANFETDIKAHLESFLTIFQNQALQPKRKYNRQLMIETTQQVLLSFSDKQRKNLITRLTELKEDINRLIQN